MEWAQKALAAGGGVGAAAARGAADAQALLATLHLEAG
jgi:hypothetical protein